MSGYDLERMQKKLKKYLDKERFEHTIGVVTPVQLWPCVTAAIWRRLRWQVCSTTAPSAFQMTRS